jgi:hypothetical protein
MLKNKNAEPTDDGEDSFRFTVILPSDIAPMFLASCEEEDRSLSEMARYIIRMYYRNMEAQMKAITRLREEKFAEPTHRFPDVKPDLRRDVTG